MNKSTFSKNIELAVSYIDEMNELISSCRESIKTAASVTEAWDAVDKCYQDLEAMRNRQKCTGSKSFPLKTVMSAGGVDGHTKYLQGIDLPIKINSIINENNELVSSDVSEMHIGNVDGIKTLLITPEIISYPDYNDDDDSVVHEKPDNQEKVTTVCYGKEEVWNSRKEAEDFYLDCMANSEGAECMRYVRIYEALKAGKSVCTDDEY